MSDRTRVRRWRIALAGTMTLVSVGLLAAEPFLLAATAVPLAYVLYGALARVPRGADLATRREVVDADPAPGDPIRVRLTVENVGSASLTDVRVVDGVPEELVVVEGSPRASLSLRPGESATVAYAVVAKRGTYAFSAPVVRVRPLAATEVVASEVPAEGDTSLTCANVVSEPPPTDATLPRAGTQPTDSGGAGVEFHATRDYQPGDPVNRIDWRRFAKTNELTTVQYREEQAVRTVLVVDARPPTRVTPEAGYPTGAELGAYAAERLLDALGRTGTVASVVAVGLADADVPGGRDPDGLAWVDAGGPGAADARAAHLFDGVQDAAARGPDVAATDGGRRADGEPAAGVSEAVTDGEGDAAAAGPAAERPPDDAVDADGAEGEDAPADDAGATAALLARLPPTAQVVVFSPLVDEWPVDLSRSLAVRGYPTTVVAPDVTGGSGRARTVVGLERAVRVEAVERAGATVIDWDLDRPIDVALRHSLAHLFA